jgi:hypothetical protein
MPLTKYRSVEEMAAAAEQDRPLGALSGLRSALVLSELCSRLAGRRLPAGVHRFGSIEEENRQREEWECVVHRIPSG